MMTWKAGQTLRDQWRSRIATQRNAAAGWRSADFAVEKALFRKRAGAEVFSTKDASETRFFHQHLTK